MSQQRINSVEINPAKPPKASVIWLHGLGADGHDFVPIIPQLDLPDALNVRFVFPHAPIQPVTINGGYRMRAWYDVLGMDINAQEDEKGIRASEQILQELIKHEEHLGVPTRHIVIAGFSQGGAMVLQCGLRYPKRLAGILALSCYLPLPHTLTKEASDANKNIPIFMAHGNLDTLIPPAIGQASSNFLRQLGYAVDFRRYPVAHGVCPEEIVDIGKWFCQVLS